MKIVRKLRKWWRSAISGRFVSRDYAKANPWSTVEEKEDPADMARRLKRGSKVAEFKE